MDCQARDKWKLDFAFNASFTSLNVAKVTMKEMGMEYADAIRVNQNFIHQSQLLFGYGKQRHQSPICQATPDDVCLRSILGW